MASSLTSKPYQQLRLLLVSPSKRPKWNTTSIRTRSRSAPPNRALEYNRTIGLVPAVNVDVAQNEARVASIGLCDKGNKFPLLPTPSTMPLADVVNSNEQRFLLPFKKTATHLPKLTNGILRPAVTTATVHHRIIHSLSTGCLPMFQLSLSNAHHIAIISLPFTVQFHSAAGNQQSQAAGNAASATNGVIQIPVTFEQGHFKLYFFDRYEAILHYWQPIDALYETLRVEILPNAKWDRIGADLKQIQKFRMYNHEERFPESGSSTSDSSSATDGPAGAEQAPNNLLTQQFRLAPTMPFGYLFVALNPSRIQLTGYSVEKSNAPVIFQFKLNAGTLKKIVDWSQKNSVGSSGVSGGSSMTPSKAATFAKHELMFLEQEKYNLRSKFEPLQLEFNRLISRAKVDAHRRFKMGGLFLLSAQLGFVARLTWFDYSWDLLEPVTFCLTYSMMLGTFAYYIVTSEEYIVPMVERRMVVKKFWKLVKSENFDVRRYRLLRDELASIEKQIRALQKENFQ